MWVRSPFTALTSVPPTLPSAALPESSPTLCCRRPRCWRGCGPGEGCRAATRVEWPVDPGAAASWQGEPARARASRAGRAGPAGTRAQRGRGRPWAGSGARRPVTLPTYLPQGPASTEGLGGHEPQDAPGPWLPEHGQGQQGLSGGPQVGVRLQHRDEDGTQLRGQACPRAGPHQGWGLAPPSPLSPQLPQPPEPVLPAADSPPALAPRLTSSELRGQVALTQPLPALPTAGQFHVASHLQDGKAQAGGRGQKGGGEGCETQNPATRADPTLRAASLHCEPGPWGRRG